jgi:hypothetical protein
MLRHALALTAYIGSEGVMERPSTCVLPVHPYSCHPTCVRCNATTFLR